MRIHLFSFHIQYPIIHAVIDLMSRSRNNYICFFFSSTNYICSNSFSCFRCNVHCIFIKRNLLVTLNFRFWCPLHLVRKLKHTI